MFPEAVVCLPGRAYRLLTAGKNLDDDQVNTVSLMYYNVMTMLVMVILISCSLKEKQGEARRSLR
jgi:hypothetical protein